MLESRTACRSRQRIWNSIHFSRRISPSLQPDACRTARCERRKGKFSCCWVRDWWTSNWPGGFKSSFNFLDFAKLYSKILEPLRKKQQTDKVGFKRTNLKLHKTRKASILLSEARAPVACWTRAVSSRREWWQNFRLLQQNLQSVSRVFLSWFCLSLWRYSHPRRLCSTRMFRGRSDKKDKKFRFFF